MGFEIMKYAFIIFAIYIEYDDLKVGIILPENRVKSALQAR